MGFWEGVFAQAFYDAAIPGGEDALIANAKDAGLAGIIIKYADGDTYGDQTRPTVFRDQFREIAPKIKAAGLTCVAWVYVYGQNPAGEVAVLATAPGDGADAALIDAEYEEINHKQSATLYLRQLRRRVGNDFPIGFEPDFRILVGNSLAPYTAQSVDLTTEPWPWRQFLESCDIVAPQLYWPDFQLSPAETFGLVDAYRAACVQQNWARRPVVPVLPFNASADDLVTGLRLGAHSGSVASIIWRADLLSPDQWQAVKTWIAEESTVNKEDVGTYSMWCQLRLKAGSGQAGDTEVRGTIGYNAFIEFLKGTGRDYTDPYRWGWPEKQATS